MTDVFISYKREDYQRVDKLAAVLRDLKLKVWHDASLIAGEDWQVRIEQIASSAKAVVVCWSEAAERSPHVQREIAIGRERGVLVLVRFDAGKLPTQYRVAHVPDLSEWDGDLADRGLGQFVEGLSHYTGAPLGSFLRELSGGHSVEAVSALRRKLVEIARRGGAPITYGEAKEAIADAYMDGRGTPERTMYGTLDAIAGQNRDRREPPLFALVVDPNTRIPGRGYFQKHCFVQDHEAPMARHLFEMQLQEVYRYGWPNDA